MFGAVPVERAEVAERPGELRPASGDAALHGADGHPEALGDLAVVEVVDVAEHDGDPELLGQVGDGTLEVGSVGDRRVDGVVGVLADTVGEVDRLVGAGGTVASARERHGRPSTTPPELVEAGIGGHAVRPGGERRAAVETGQATCDGDEGLLGGVGGVGGVAGDPPAHGEDAVVVTAQQLLERVAVAALRGCHQGEIVVGGCDGARLASRRVSGRSPQPMTVISLMAPRYGLSWQPSDGPSS